MNSQASKQVAIAAWRTLGTRDPRQIAAAFTEDAEWLAPDNNATAAALHGPSHIIGREQIGRMFGTEVWKLFATNVAVDIRGVYADGNTIVIEQRLRATLANGHPYDNDYCFVLELKDGLIHRVREYMDTAKGNRMVLATAGSADATRLK